MNQRAEDAVPEQPIVQALRRASEGEGGKQHEGGRRQERQGGAQTGEGDSREPQQEPEQPYRRKTGPQVHLTPPPCPVTS